MSVLDTLKSRGLFSQVSNENLGKQLEEKKLTVYIGFDPTADSLHIGSLVPLICAAHFQRAGHRVLLIVGGATGMVGDPSGRSLERNLLTLDDVKHNVACIKTQMEQFVSFEGDAPAAILNNYDWISAMSFIDWLRDVGKHFTVNYMVAKDSVKSRMSDESGISFTEFSYMTMQAYDFLHLYENEGCTLQAGGSDQWGNITAGIDLIRKRGGEAMGVTFPLVTTSSGEKFGKSAGNAIWLDEKLTSAYNFYQYWMNTDDRDVIKYIKFFTFLELDEIKKLEAKQEQEPGKREAQKALAWEVTKLVHGEAKAEKARNTSTMIFGSEVSGLTDAELEEVFSEAPSVTLSLDRLNESMNMIDLLAESGACKSKGEARRLLTSGGAYLNNVRVSELERTLSKDDLVGSSTMVIRTGKKKYRLIRFE